MKYPTLVHSALPPFSNGHSKRLYWKLSFLVDTIHDVNEGFFTLYQTTMLYCSIQPAVVIAWAVCRIVKEDSTTLKYSNRVILLSIKGRKKIGSCKAYLDLRSLQKETCVISYKNGVQHLRLHRELVLCSANQNHLTNIHFTGYCCSRT